MQSTRHIQTKIRNGILAGCLTVFLAAGSPIQAVETGNNGVTRGHKEVKSDPNPNSRTGSRVVNPAPRINPGTTANPTGAQSPMSNETRAQLSTLNAIQGSVPVAASSVPPATVPGPTGTTGGAANAGTTYGSSPDSEASVPSGTYNSGLAQPPPIAQNISFFDSWLNEPERFTSADTIASMNDSDFVDLVATADHKETLINELARKQANNPQIKSLAETLAADHARASADFQSIARDRGVELSSQFTNFDRRYLDQVIRDHQRRIAQYQHIVQSGSDPALRSFAARQLPILQDHLRKAETLSQQALAPRGITAGGTGANSLAGTRPGNSTPGVNPSPGAFGQSETPRTLNGTNEPALTAGAAGSDDTLGSASATSSTLNP